MSEYSLWSFLKDKRIEIPRVQRDYAQGRKTDLETQVRSNFLKELFESINDSKYLDYVYGQVNGDKYLILDGQQRLTTLWLLHCFVAIKAKKIGKKSVCSRLANFTYDTRISSNNFCKALCMNMGKYNGEERIVDYIKNQNWFVCSWLQDPTVSSMLVVFGGGGERENDCLEELFQDYKEEDYVKAWEHLTSFKVKETLHFEWLPIETEELPIADDLYIKMNGRGKRLTDFENFKSDLTKGMVVSADKKKDLVVSIDNKWNDCFFSYVKNSLEYVNEEADQSTEFDAKLDDYLFQFMNVFFLNQICLRKEGSSYVLSPEVFKYKREKLPESIKENELKKSVFNQFDVLYGRYASKGRSAQDYKIKYLSNTLYLDYWKEDILSVLDKLFSYISVVLDLDKDEKSVKANLEKLVFDNDGYMAFLPAKSYPKVDESKYSDKLEPKNTTQNQRIFMSAFCAYVNHHSVEWIKTEEGKKDFERWMRITKNIIKYGDVDTIPDMVRGIRFMNELADVIFAETDGKTVDVFDGIISLFDEEFAASVKNKITNDKLLEEEDSSGNEDEIDDDLDDDQAVEEGGKANSLIAGFSATGAQLSQLLEEAEKAKMIKLKPVLDDKTNLEKLLVSVENKKLYSGTIRFLYRNADGKFDLTAFEEYGSGESIFEKKCEWVKTNVRREDDNVYYVDVKSLKGLLLGLGSFEGISNKPIINLVWKSRRNANWNRNILCSEDEEIQRVVHDLLLSDSFDKDSIEASTVFEKVILSDFLDKLFVRKDPKSKDLNSKDLKLLSTRYSYRDDKGEAGFYVNMKPDLTRLVSERRLQFNNALKKHEEVTITNKSVEIIGLGWVFIDKEIRFKYKGKSCNMTSVFNKDKSADEKYTYKINDKEWNEVSELSTILASL